MTAIGRAWADGAWNNAAWAAGVWATEAAATTASEPRGSVPREYYDFGEHYPSLPEADKQRIDDIIASITPNAERRLARGKPTKTLRKRIAQVLPEYAAHKPKPTAAYLAEAERRLEVEMRAAREEEERERDDEEALLIILMLAA